MSKDQTATPSKAMKIDTDLSPTPRWAGEKFKCEKCSAEYQLEAGDRCVLRLILNDHLETYDTPACWNCEHVNVITIDRPLAPYEQAGAS